MPDLSYIVLYYSPAREKNQYHTEIMCPVQRLEQHKKVKNRLGRVIFPENGPGSFLAGDIVYAAIRKTKLPSTRTAVLDHTNEPNVIY